MDCQFWNCFGFRIVINNFRSNLTVSTFYIVRKPRMTNLEQGSDVRAHYPIILLWFPWADLLIIYDVIPNVGAGLLDMIICGSVGISCWPSLLRLASWKWFSMKSLATLVTLWNIELLLRKVANSGNSSTLLWVEFKILSALKSGLWFGSWNGWLDCKEHG